MTAYHDEHENLLATPTDEGKITDAEVEAAAEALWDDQMMVLGWKAASEIAATQPDSDYVRLVPLFRKYARSALLAASRVRLAGEAVAWAVASRTGMHIGLWDDEHTAWSAAAMYQGSTVRPLYASPAPSYADAIRDCLGAVEAAREKIIHSGAVDFVSGVREGHTRSINAIEALTSRAPL